MKKWIVAICVLVAFVLLKPHAARFLRSGGPDLVYHDEVNRRVENMMRGWTAGGTGTSSDAEIALSLWAKGVAAIADTSELSRASDGFDRFRRRKQLYRAISSYEITDITVTPDSLPQTAVVQITIEGKPYGMIVTKGEPIRWADEATPSGS